MLMCICLSGCLDSHAVSKIVDAGAGALSSDAPLSTQTTSLCARWAAIQCDGEQRCCDTPSRSLDDCERALHDACEQTLFLDQVAMNPIAGYDAAEADHAFADFAQRAADCDPSVASWMASPTGLRGILRGTLDEGKSCKPVDALNADGATLAAALVGCQNPDRDACLPASLLGDWTCAPKQAAGGSCVTAENCASGNYCDSPSSAALGTCVAALPLMASCESADQCAAGGCVAQKCVEANAQTAYCATQ
jgi:hypothetical protein